MMKKNVLLALLFGSVIWASTYTYKYYELKNNPLVLKVSADEAFQSDHDNAQLLSLEKVAFLKQFTAQYLSFDSTNFWQSQIALTYLMESDLQNERKQEINRLKDKIENKKVSQHGVIKSVTLLQENLYVVESDVYEQENSNIQHQFTSSLKMSLVPTTRTLQNPSGLLVSTIEYNRSTDTSQKEPALLVLNHDYPLQLTFPCRVENVEVEKGLPLSIKLTTLNFSELQILRKAPLEKVSTIKAFCQNQIYKLTMTPNGASSSLYRNIAKELAENRQNKLTKTRSQNSGSPYQKTIEDELGFVIDE